MNKNLGKTMMPVTFSSRPTQNHHNRTTISKIENIYPPLLATVSQRGKVHSKQNTKKRFQFKADTLKDSNYNRKNNKCDLNSVNIFSLF